MCVLLSVHMHISCVFVACMHVYARSARILFVSKEHAARASQQALRNLECPAAEPRYISVYSLYMLSVYTTVLRKRCQIVSIRVCALLMVDWLIRAEASEYR